MSHTDELMLGEDIDCSLIKEAAPYFITVDSARKYLSACQPDSMSIETKERFDSRLKSLLKTHRLEIKNSDDHILSLNEGVTVLYGAYQKAQENNQTAVCEDINHHLKSISNLYRQKVYSDYINLCNFVLDVPVNFSDAPVLNTLIDVRQTLKNQNRDLMHIDHEQKNVSDFWQTVGEYAKDMGVDVRFLPTFRISSPLKQAGNANIMTRC